MSNNTSHADSNFVYSHALNTPDGKRRYVAVHIKHNIPFKLELFDGDGQTSLLTIDELMLNNHRSLDRLDGPSDKPMWKKRLKMHNIGVWLTDTVFRVVVVAPSGESFTHVLYYEGGDEKTYSDTEYRFARIDPRSPILVGSCGNGRNRAIIICLKPRISDAIDPWPKTELVPNTNVTIVGEIKPLIADMLKKYSVSGFAHMIPGAPMSAQTRTELSLYVGHTKPK